MELNRDSLLRVVQSQDIPQLDVEPDLKMVKAGVSMQAAMYKKNDKCAWWKSIPHRAIIGHSRLVGAPLRNQAKKYLLCVFYVMISRPKT